MSKFRLWVENVGQGVISFDFDSTLTSPVQDEEGVWLPGDAANDDHINHQNHELMRKYANQGYKIIIVTSRLNSQKPEVEAFVKKHKLPVSEVVATNGLAKGPLLQQLGVLMHHDDSPHEWEDPSNDFKGKWVKVFHPMD
mgnify:CR=1 FL=1